MENGKRATSRKLNIRRFGKRLGALVLIGVLAVAAVLYRDSNSIGVSSKPTVYIVDIDYVANTSSGEQMRQYLQGLGYSVTITNATATLPTHATANGYDVIIFSTGNLAYTSITAADMTWANEQLNGLNGATNTRLLMEGDNWVKYLQFNNNTALRSSLLHATAWGGTDYSPATLNYLGNLHPIVNGITATNPNYSSSNTNIRPFTPDAGSTSIYRLSNTSTQPCTVLSAWQGANRNSRMVVMDFLWWDSSTSKGVNNAAWRQTLLQQSVDWLGEFVEATYSTTGQPTNVNPSTTGVYMGKLTFSNNISTENTTVTGFTVQNTGSSTDASISNVNLYDDTNGNGTYEPGTDTLIKSVPMSAGSAIFSGLSIAANSTGKTVFITFDVPSGADQGKTLQASISSGSITTSEGSLVKTIGALQSNAVTINDITPPTVPNGVYTTNLQTGTSLRIAWNANTDTDLVGYNVYRDTSPTGSFSTLVANVAKPTTYCTDTGLTELTTYYYKVNAYDQSGNISAKSSPAAQGIPNSPPATAPTGLTVTDQAIGQTLKITWTAHTVSDLAGYNLYVALASGGPYGKVNSGLIPKSATPSFTHTGLSDGATYYYKVSAVDTGGLESPLSSPVSGTPTDTTPPNIISLYPANGQDHVSKNVVIKVTFDDPMDPASVNSTTIQLKDSNNQPITGTVSYDSVNHEVRFTPDSALPPAGTFTATLKGASPNGVRNATGLYLGSDQTWTFGTLLNPHINFQTNNVLCGYCHSAHSATGTQIIRAPRIVDLCLLCHDGTGSSYDVKSGIYFNGDNPEPLLSGGYDLAMGSTSTHFTDLANFVYGGSQTPMTVDCNNCHEPHGSTNYRNLRTIVNGTPVTVTGIVYGPSYAVKTVSGREVATYVYGINQFCGVCHMDYLVYNSANTRDGSINWRHRVGIGLTGGSTGGDFQISYPQPGLYTTLPTEGAPTGANVNNYDILPGGALAANTYNYIVTGKNAVGESVYGKVLQVTTNTANQKIKIYWEPITNAYKYRIYRYIGTLDVRNFNPANFLLVAEVGDDPTSFVDDGSITTTATSPPTSSTATITCLTCHYSHGTTATAEEPTRLRRLDNNGVCEDCHKK